MDECREGLARGIMRSAWLAAQHCQARIVHQNNARILTNAGKIRGAGNNILRRGQFATLFVEYFLVRCHPPAPLKS